MPVNSEALGAELGERTVRVTARMMLAYAAGIGETGALTFDDSSEKFIASRAFCVVLEWPLISGDKRQRVLGLHDDELRRGVHVEQDSQFHRVIRVGDRLRTTGVINAVRSTAAGAFVQYRLETRLDGKPVTTTFYGVIFRGVEIDGPGGTVDASPIWPAAETDAPMQEIRIAVAQEAAQVYTECSGIWNPLHSERRVALSLGFPNVILHGTATWALAGRELVREHGGQDPSRLLRLRARFKAPVFPGSVIHLRHMKSVGGSVHFAVHRDDGQAAVLDGYASFATEHPN